MKQVCRALLTGGMLIASVSATVATPQDRSTILPDLAVTAIRPKQEIRFGTCNAIDVDLRNSGAGVTTPLTASLSIENVSTTPYQVNLTGGLAANASRTVTFEQVDLSRCNAPFDESSLSGCVFAASISGTRVFERNLTNNSKREMLPIYKTCGLGLSARFTNLSSCRAGQTCNISVRFENIGLADTIPTTVSLYRQVPGVPDIGSLGQQPLRSLRSGEQLIVYFSGVNIPSGRYTYSLGYRPDPVNNAPSRHKIQTTVSH